MQKRDYINIVVTSTIFLLFVAFIVMVKTIDVGIAGFSGVEVGFSTLNQNIFNAFRFHSLEVVSDVLFILALALMLAYAVVGLVQLIKYRSFKKVDYSLICLAGCYVLMIVIFMIFELFPINYRPILVDGEIEPSFPSTHTMLAIVSFVTAGIEIGYLTKCEWLKPASFVLGIVFALVATISRLLSGVHWFTDIVGAVLVGAFIVEAFVTSLELVETIKEKNTPMPINAEGLDVGEEASQDYKKEEREEYIAEIKEKNLDKNLDDNGQDKKIATTKKSGASASKKSK